MPKPETRLVADILHYLRVKGYFCKRNQSGTIFQRSPTKSYAIRLGEPGWPDVIAIHKDGSGRFIGIEAKVKPNKPTEEQLRALQRIEKDKGIAIVAYSLDDVINAGL